MPTLAYITYRALTRSWQEALTRGGRELVEIPILLVVSPRLRDLLSKHENEFDDLQFLEVGSRDADAVLRLGWGDSANYLRDWASGLEDDSKELLEELKAVHRAAVLSRTSVCARLTCPCRVCCLRCLGM